jgi:hypothetical protein
MAESLGIESNLLVEQTPPEEQLPLSEPESYIEVTEKAEHDESSDEAIDDIDPDDPGPSVH